MLPSAASVIFPTVPSFEAHCSSHLCIRPWTFRVTRHSPYKKSQESYTSRTALMQPSFSGLFVTWAYLPEKKKRKISVITSQLIIIDCVSTEIFCVLKSLFNSLNWKWELYRLHRCFWIISRRRGRAHHCRAGKNWSWAISEHSPQITFPPCVTKPSSLTLTSTTVPFVMTPREV